MPIYEYICTKCGKRFELHRRITDSDREIKCPKCGNLYPKRIISTFSTNLPNAGCSSDYFSGST
ncbi:zinc ribbon domain-containing protein [Chloroflexota bacterium]